MNKYIIALATLLTASSSLLLSGCAREDELNKESSIVDTNTPSNEFDVWLQENYLDAYNIEFGYRYRDILIDQNRVLTPADYNQSVILAKLTLHLVLGAYDENTGSTEFMKTYYPKLIQLVGCPSYNADGSVVLGEAEGGKAIYLYDVNSLEEVFKSEDIEVLNDRYFHTMHHEFAHILHQTKPYSKDYGSYSASLYVGSDCFKTYPTLESALMAGFITPYSSTNADEDFVEILSTYITISADRWESLMETAETEDAEGVAAGGRKILEQKLSIIRGYLLTSWGINMDTLREVIMRRQGEVWDLDYSLLLE